MQTNNNALRPGTILRSSQYTYHIQQSLGQGSFGITYLATTQVKGKTVFSGSLGNIETESYQTVNVAIKEFFMKEANSRSSDGSTVEGTEGEFTSKYRKKFRKEAENLSHLKHPNIVQVLEVFDANNTTYYAMQYIDGQSLDEYIKSKGHLDEQEAVSIIRQVALPLQYMHSKNMLHLDLKPKNIMLDVNNIPYLIDFGLSKQYDDKGEPESSTSIGFGTPGYAPVEQANYKQDGTFPATLDVYALGATLYKMLVGATPPVASDILSDGLPKCPPHISSLVWSVIDKAMQPNKNNRPQTVQDFLDILDNRGKHDDSESTHKTPLDRKGQENDLPKNWNELIAMILSSRWGVAGGAAALAVIIILVFMFTNRSRGNSISDGVVYVADSIAEPVADVRTVEKQFFRSGMGECSYSGPVDEAFSDGRLYQGLFEHGVMTGNAIFKYANGDTFEGIFANNSVSEGKYSVKNNGRYFQGRFKNGKPDKGNWYDKNGIIIQAANEDMGKKTANENNSKPTIKQDVTQASQTTRQTNNEKPQMLASINENKNDSNENEIYYVVEHMPEFDGGISGLMQYLNEAIKYPAIAAENGKQGRVVVQFVVNRDGSISDVKVITSVDPYLDREAIRVISSMPKWKPGINHGIPVRVRYTVPVNFRLT